MTEPEQQREPRPVPASAPAAPTAAAPGSAPQVEPDATAGAADPASVPATTAADSASVPATTAADSGGIAAIASWSAPSPDARHSVAISPRTGEPTRLATIWVATVASYLAVAVVGAATIWIYWDAVDRFAEASWLMAQFDTAPGSLARVLLAVAVTAITLVVGTLSAITGYYAYDGRRWTRWFGLVAFGASLLALMLNPLAWAVPVLAAVAAAALWLPPSTRYFAAWQAVRRHEPVFSEPPEHVVYGPLPRYR